MNRAIIILFACISLTVFSSCIEFFHPDLGSSVKAKYVVDGQITDQEGYQTVYVSMTTSIEKPKYNPLSFCEVKIIDSNGNVYNLSETASVRGEYKVLMAKESLKPGTSYQVNVKTAAGVEIVSEFDQMPECPEIDSLYYFRKDYPNTNPDKTTQGIQFYVDIDRKNTGSKYFRWEINETWEHHAVYPITWYVDPDSGLILKPFPDYSMLKCWTTAPIKDIFTFSASNISQSKLKMLPLQYVDNQTQRLTFCYSILVYQYSLSEPAFRFWDNLRKNNNEQGGLYSSQPLRIKGNLKSTTNPELEVLGFFGASSVVKSKRIFVQNLDNFDVLEPSCAPPQPPDDSFKYYIDVGAPTLMGLLNGCIECDYMGGTTVKPNYWPN